MNQNNYEEMTKEQLIEILTKYVNKENKLKEQRKKNNSKYYQNRKKQKKTEYKFIDN
jgi:hypothetical protein